MSGPMVSTRDEAVARAERIRAGIEAMAALQGDIAAAYHRRDWTTLGYDSWASYVTAEFGERRLKLSLHQRREIVASLRGEGLSTRAIGAALGVHHDTVVTDIRSVGNPTVEPTVVTGLNGKTYSTQPGEAVDSTTESVVRDGTKPAAGEPPAPTPDRRFGRGRTAQDAIEATVTTVRDLCDHFESLIIPADFAALDAERAEQWAQALDKSMSVLRQIRKELLRRAGAGRTRGGAE
ncbi:helix-turn-helix domain-containing protein [Saccharothrix variisporea]|uniref:Homeodomain-like domain-containing protein n=1 Tax=Saccharothrix variisporea TaxID=543527 RepID=A0A495X3B3_9PSEU|nr:helix-turn-helix domain-containing protein [Saccharothrix variisporea]RKT67083.1 hypothetical protein DFJ66_0251 [Saccharothrix variisporea]